jgi:hypothetical protein
MNTFLHLLSTVRFRKLPVRGTRLNVEELEPRALLAVNPATPLTAVIPPQAAAAALARPAVASPLQAPGSSLGSSGFNAAGTGSVAAVPPGVGLQDPVNQSGLQAYFLQGQPAVSVSPDGLVSPLANVSPLAAVSSLQLPFRYYQQSGSGVDVMLPPLQAVPVLPVVSADINGAAHADNAGRPSTPARPASDRTAADRPVEPPSPSPTVTASPPQLVDAYLGKLAGMDTGAAERARLMSEPSKAEDPLAAGALILIGATATGQHEVPDDLPSEAGSRR